MRPSEALFVVFLLAIAGCVDTTDAPGTEPDPDQGTNGNGGGPSAPAPESKLAVTAAAPYSFSPKTLAAKAGAVVNLTLTNTDPLAPHDWVLDEADAATESIGNGETSNVVFVAPEAGTYTFYCSVGNHRTLGMVGTFTVT